MKARVCRVLALSALLALGGFSAAARDAYRVVSDKTIDGFSHPASVACDTRGRVLYVSNFGSPRLDPALKDGAGFISKTTLDGRVVERHFLPAQGGEPLHKPGGIWIRGNLLWVTDIDAVWAFDLRTRMGRKLALPGILVASDLAVADNVLYVSDDRGDRLVKVEPADFLHGRRAPRTDLLFRDVGVNPNGLYPAPDGRLLMAGFVAPDQPRGLFALGAGGRIERLSTPLGRLDGVYVLPDGSLLATDWNTGTLFHWSEGGPVRELAGGFKGPADFCVMPRKGGLLAAVPDLVQSQVRLIQLRK